MIKEEKRLDLDKKLAASSGWERFRLITGGLCFIVGATFVLIHLGFVKDSSVSIDFEPRPFLSRIELWLWNLSLGSLGGILLGHPKYLSGLVAGIIAAAVITGTTLFYLSWRDSIFMAEIIIPMLTGLIGIFVYRFLVK